MKGNHRSGSIRNVAAVATLSMLLSACLSDGGGSSFNSGEEPVNDHELSGSVGDGPVIGATITVLRNDGIELAQAESDANSSYTVSVRTEGQYYPLSIRSQGGTDLVTNSVPDFDLRSAVFAPSSRSVANVNPFSTFAVELASDLPGGTSSSNLQTAEDIVSTELNYGLSSLVTRGPITTRIDGSNIAEIVRASEALGETVRRTRDALTASGFSASANQVVRAVASDLTDNVVDGRGGVRVASRSAAAWTVVSAQVLLETMANELHVNGANATQAMRDAISQVSTSTVDPELDDLTVTAEMLSQARIGLVAAHAVTNDDALEELLSALEGVQVGASSSTIKSFVLPSDYRSRLNNAVLLVAGGSNMVLNSVNDVARDRKQTIGDENRAPTISGTPDSAVQVGQPYSFTPTSSDPDGDTLTFGITNLPTWASFNTTNGSLSGTPGPNDGGDYTGITISVSDGELSSSIGPFSINVYLENVAPEISGTPPDSVTVGQQYIFTPTASDANGDTLTFSAFGVPQWLSIDSTNGRLSGTPTANDVGVYSGISIQVSDDRLSSTLGPFSIEVISSGTNSPPTIDGTPATEVMVGNNYSFLPIASDPDGDTLSFSVTGLPGWASFNALNGELSGIPGSGDVGTYTDITITVSDGFESASLAPFSITVQAVATGSVTLNWTAPTQNEDGTTLTDLDGYRIYWGTTSGEYPNSVTIDNESVTTYIIDNLVPGTYEFVATSFNTSGVESIYSAPATKTVQ